MKNRILCFILALLICISLFAACDGVIAEETTVLPDGVTESGTNTDDATESGTNTDEGTVSGAETTAAVEVTPSDKEKDYDDSFYLWIVSQYNPINYYWVEESNGSAFSEAIFNRQEQVRESLGVEIVGSVPGDHWAYSQKFKTEVKNMTGAVDTLISSTAMDISGLISTNSLRDFANMPGIDLDKEYWNTDFMDSLSVNGKYYLGQSDFNVLSTYVISFNKDLMGKYQDQLEKDVYQMVRDREWTIDAMINLAKLAYIEGDSVETTQYGFAGHQEDAWVGFMHASELTLVELGDDGYYQISFMNDANRTRMDTLVKSLTEFAAADYTCIEYMTKEPLKAPITSGKTLMQLSHTHQLPEYLGGELDFGILPYPLFDTKQENYHSLQFGGYICIPSYLRNDEMVGDVLETLSLNSEEVNAVFYDELLGEQTDANLADREMLDIVWNSVCTDFGLAFSNEAQGLPYFLPVVTTGWYTLAGYYAQNAWGWNNKLENYIKKLSNNNP